VKTIPSFNVLWIGMSAEPKNQYVQGPMTLKVRKAILAAINYKQLESVLSDKSLSARHESARRLLEFVRLNLDPTKRLGQVTHALLEPHPSGDLSQQVFDLTSLLDRFTPAQTESAGRKLD
jgi:hypothetical protein